MDGRGGYFVREGPQDVRVVIIRPAWWGCILLRALQCVSSADRVDLAAPPGPGWRHVLLLVSWSLQLDISGMLVVHARAVNNTAMFVRIVVLIGCHKTRHM